MKPLWVVEHGIGSKASVVCFSEKSLSSVESVEHALDAEESKIFRAHVR